MFIRTYKDAVVIITGGASGIGKAFAKKLAADGATVIIADRQDDIVQDVAREIGGASGKVTGAALDVRDAEKVERFVADVFAQHGRVDYLFNNAGTGTVGEVKDLTLDDWKYVVDVNLMGVIHFVHAVYPRMVKQGFGHIVNTASAAGLLATPFALPYCTTKHAVVGLSRALRLEGLEHGVRATAICPGVIRTPLLLNGGRYGRVKIEVPTVAAQMEAWEMTRPMDVDVFAGRVLRDVAKNKPIIIHPRSWWAVVWLDRLLPGLSERLGARFFGMAKEKLTGRIAEKV